MGRMRYERLYVMVTPEEKEAIKEKMKLINSTNIGEFVRKALLVTTPIGIETSGVDSLIYEVNRIGNNINQIAKISNQTKNIYKNDILDMQSKVSELENMLKVFKNILQKIGRGVL